MADRERAVTEEEALFAGVPGSGAIGDALVGRRFGRGGRDIFLRVAEAMPGDIDKGYVRLHPAAFEALGISPASMIAVQGRRTTVVRAEAVPGALPGEGTVRMDGVLRDNAECGIGDRVRVRPAAAMPAFGVVLVPDDGGPLGDDELRRVREFLAGRAITAGDRVNVTSLSRGDVLFKIVETEPEGAGLVIDETHIRTRVSTMKQQQRTGQVRYEDIGGLEREVTRVRELVELPMKYPRLFAKLRIEPPRGVLLYGPPGTGKTLIARAVASEVEAHFIHVNGPEIMKKYLGESEATLREIFEEAQRQAPTIIFLDEVDAIAPKRSDVAGDVEKRVVAQLLTLMDGLVQRGNVVVIAATNMPELVDPALRRPGRFDREVPVNVPDRESRGQIIRIHARGMPLAEDVDLDRLAEVTHGFVGADLEMLCKEAGMLALHEVLDQADFDTADPLVLAERAQIHLRHFFQALKGIEPATTRELIVERPMTRWGDVGGLRDLRDFLQLAVEYPRKRPELFEQAGIKPAKGILLTGPTGTGKSLLARAVAGEAGVGLIVADASTLLSKWLGESEKAIRQVFTKAKQASPCVLFFDELDAIAPSRGGDSSGGAMDRIVGQFLGELDRLDELSEVIVLGATNRPDLLDPALLAPSRFGFVLELPQPDEAARLEILQIHTRKMPLADDVDLVQLAKDTDDFSGSDLAALCQRAAMLAIRAAVETGGEGPAEQARETPLQISRERFDQALPEARKAVASRARPSTGLVRLTGGFRLPRSKG
ncbi:MAG: CDC48 family AAA ATPase [Chloroflexi bacterium]|nr:CDC48 family AAA ATPase [Chloroflexota bacterium]